MPITFEQSKDEIARRVKHYLTNRAHYRGGAYKEAHARQEFIDPLFIALGWDVHDTQRLAPDYREVVIEDSLEIEGATSNSDSKSAVSMSCSTSSSLISTARAGNSASR
jgi:hypothetical protein